MKEIEPLPYSIFHLDTPLNLKEVNYLRGALGYRLPEEIFHPSKQTSKYPFLQIKSFKNKGQILLLGELGQWNELLSNAFAEPLDLDGKPVLVNIEKVELLTFTPQINTYLSNQINLTYWLPFRDRQNEFYNQFKQEERLLYRVQHLERILNRNITFFIKSFFNADVYADFEERVQCKIKNIKPNINGIPTTAKRQIGAVPAYHLEISSNISLPYLLGIGSHVRMGYGLVT